MVWLRDRLPRITTRAQRARDRALQQVPERVGALSRFVDHAGPHLGPSIVEQAANVVARAGGRLALSGSHTVVALAGTTGSGKSSLFNALAGTPLLASLLYGITPKDVPALGVAPLLMAGVAAFACWLPARKSSR